MTSRKERACHGRLEIQRCDMLITRRLKLVSPLLAAKHSGNKDGGPHRIFVKVRPPRGEDPDRVYIATPLSRWNWAFLEARDALGIEDAATSAIIPAHWYSVKKTSTYNRKFRRGQHGDMRTEQFESLPTGQVFELTFTLSKHVPPNTDGGGRYTRTPDEEEFDAMLAHIGEHLGMSEWGQHYLYGRFEIKPPAGDGAPPTIKT